MTWQALEVRWSGLRERWAFLRRPEAREFGHQLQLRETAAPTELTKYAARKRQLLISHARLTVPYFREVITIRPSERVDEQMWSALPISSRAEFAARGEQGRSAAFPELKAGTLRDPSYPVDAIWSRAARLHRRQGGTITVWGARELPWIGSQCHRGHLHVFCDLAHLEILDPSGAPAPAGEQGRIIVTELDNRVHPLIRVDLGLVGRLAVEHCDCRCTLPVLHLDPGDRPERPPT